VQTLGVGTLSDILDVHRLGTKQFSRPLILEQLADLVDSGVITKVGVAGWAGDSYADSSALGQVSATSRTTLLSPFDSLVWHRSRVARLFDFDFQLEAYVPAPKRVHGYFTMPVLHRGRLVARVDPKRIKDTLHARQVTFETDAKGRVPAANVVGVARAIREAAAWVGATTVRADRIVPASSAAALTAELAGSAS
jgi:uncharacterized protein YcaQ